MKPEEVSQVAEDMKQLTLPSKKREKDQGQEIRAEPPIDHAARQSTCLLPEPQVARTPSPLVKIVSLRTILCLTRHLTTGYALSNYNNPTSRRFSHPPQLLFSSHHQITPSLRIYPAGMHVAATIDQYVMPMVLNHHSMTPWILSTEKALVPQNLSGCNPKSYAAKSNQP